VVGWFGGRLQKVGWIFTQSNKQRDFILSTEEVVQIAHIQEELGPTAVTAVVSLEVDEDGSPDVHFEAFQVSRLLWG
jgi:nuclear protein localization protein 4 homolog